VCVQGWHKRVLVLELVNSRSGGHLHGDHHPNEKIFRAK
jgi:hypothetical protein